MTHGAGGVEVSVEAGEMLDLPDRSLVTANSVVILPRRRADDGKGIYGEATLFLAKELKADGVTVAYADESEDRLFEVKKSALALALITICLGVTSNAGWEGIKALVRRHHKADDPMEMTYADISKAEGTSRTWTVRGPVEGVLAAIDKIRADEGQDESSE